MQYNNMYTYNYIAILINLRKKMVYVYYRVYLDDRVLFYETLGVVNPKRMYKEYSTALFLDYEKGI